MTRSLAYVLHLAFTCAAVGIVRAARRPGRNLSPAMAAVAFAAAISFGVVNWGRATPFGDFDKAYYPAGRLVFANPAQLYRCEEGNLCFVNIPIVAAVFTPLSALPLALAHALFTILGGVAVAATGWLLLRLTGATSWRRYAIAAIVCLNGPLFYSVRLGNMSHVLLLPLLAALAWLAANRQGLAGALLALVALVKPPLFLFLPYLLARRRWRAFAAMGATTVLLCAASILWLGMGLHRTWLRDYVIELGARPIAAYNVQSISGALARLVIPGHSADWQPLDVSPRFTAVRYLITVLCLAAAFVVCAKRGEPQRAKDRWTEYSVLLCLVLLVSPISWTHYYSALVIPLALYVGDGLVIPERRPWTFAVFLAGLLISLPVVLPRPDHPLLADLTARVLISHYVFGGTLLLAILLLAMHARPGSRPVALTNGGDDPARVRT